MFFQAKYKGEYINPDLCERIDKFWEWFDLVRPQLQKLIDEHDKNVLNLIEKELCIVFEKVKEIPFALHKNKEKYEIFIFFGRNSYVLTVGDELYARMPRHIKSKWTLYIEKN